MIRIKNKKAIGKMRTAGHALAEILEAATEIIQPGITTAEIDAFVEREMRVRNLVPVCKSYGSYKHATCISLNDVVVHGIPSEDVIVADGDLVTVDVVGSFGGYCADMARCYPIGAVAPVIPQLIETAQTALDAAIALVRPGIHLSDISHCVQQHVESRGFGVVRIFAGHGIGKGLHEEPEVPNFGDPGEGPVLTSGMTLAIEPMITERSYDIIVDADGWTARTKDGGMTAHIEDTIAVTHDGVEILTRKENAMVKTV